MSAWLLIIAQYGIPTAYEIWKTLSNKNEPTEEDWQKLLAIASKTEKQYVDEAKAAFTPSPIPDPQPPTPLPPSA